MRASLALHLLMVVLLLTGTLSLSTNTDELRLLVLPCDPTVPASHRTIHVARNAHPQAQALSIASEVLYRAVPPAEAVKPLYLDPRQPDRSIPREVGDEFPDSLSPLRTLVSIATGAGEMNRVSVRNRPSDVRKTDVCEVLWV